MSDSDGRRYSREEMERILETASRPASEEGSGTLGPVEPDEGFTLAEIQEIAREVGIDPSRVKAASRTVDRGRGLEPRVSFGTYQGERHYGRRLTAREMRFVAEEADRYFGRRGAVRHMDDYLEWYDPDSRAFVGVVNEGDGARVRVIMDRAPRMVKLGGAAGVVGFAMLSTMLARGGMEGPGGLIVALILTVAAVFGFWRWQRSSILDRIDEVLDLMSLPGSGS